jgi:hypothetical protein
MFSDSCHFSVTGYLSMCLQCNQHVFDMLEPILSSGSVTVLQNSERFSLPDNLKLVWEVCSITLAFVQFKLPLC